MKKVITLMLCAVLTVFTFAGCGSAASSNVSSSASVEPDSAATTKEVKIGLIQLVQHTSLDEISEAIQAELEAKAKENNMIIDVDYQNAQGDMTTINTICQQFVADKVDLIIAVATPAAQGAAAAVDGTDIPVIFSAVTDPVAAELVNSFDAPGGNITGTSDAIPVQNIFELAKELTPEVKTFGFIYNTSEVNSVSVIKEAKAYLDSVGIAYTESAVTNSGDVQLAAQNLLGDCDAVFAPIDNTVASAMSVLSDEAVKAGKPVYCAADSMVNDGGFASVGVNYTNLGTQTADMALKVLTGTAPSDIPVEVLKEKNIVVNNETAAALGIDVSKYTK